MPRWVRFQLAGTSSNFRKRFGQSFLLTLRAVDVGVNNSPCDGVRDHNFRRKTSPASQAAIDGRSGQKVPCLPARNHAFRPPSLPEVLAVAEHRQRVTRIPSPVLQRRLWSEAKLKVNLELVYGDGHLRSLVRDRRPNARAYDRRVDSRSGVLG